MKEKIDLSVVVPCFNEQGNIPILIERIAKVFELHNIAGEVVLVDDCSKDDTWKVMQIVSEKYPFVRCLQHEVNQGIVGGWKTGANNARGEYVLIMDADLQYLPEDIFRLYSEIKKGDYDIVQGWRHYAEDNSFLRKFQSQAFSFLLNTLFLMNLRDIKSGFLVCKREVFRDILNYKNKYKHYQHIITIAAHCKGYKIKQIPVVFDKRQFGESYLKNVPIKFILNALTDIPKAFVEFRVKRGK